MDFLLSNYYRLRNLLIEPDYAKIRTLKQFANTLGGIRFDFNKITIPGWLTLNEKKALYGLSRWTSGPILEIGSWIGLSTVIISSGIQDSGRKKRFVSAEINPGLENYRPFNQGMGFFMPADSSIPKGVTSFEVYDTQIKPIVTAEGGVVGELIRNLKSYNHEEIVEIFVGDFKNVNNYNYKLIFSDTMHDPEEIYNNLPGLKRYLSIGCILACHDTNAENEEILRKELRFEDYVKIDSLFIGRIK